MNHLTEEQLVNHYYGESESPAAVSEHLRECEECSANYAALERDLAEIQPTPVPLRDAAYGEQVWHSIRGSLPMDQPSSQKSPWGWFTLNPWGLVGAATACLLMAAAFFAGRQWEHHNAPIATNSTTSGNSKQRVVLVVLGDHLDRSERLLVELKHADPSIEAPLQAEARDLLSANRLYRESVKRADDPVLAAALDHLERVLVEVANEPTGLSQARLDELQKEMNTDGLLFEVRVLRSRVQGDMEQKQGTSTATKGVPI